MAVQSLSLSHTAPGLPDQGLQLPNSYPFGLLGQLSSTFKIPSLSASLAGCDVVVVGRTEDVVVVGRTEDVVVVGRIEVVVVGRIEVVVVDMIAVVVVVLTDVVVLVTTDVVVVVTRTWLIVRLPLRS